MKQVTCLAVILGLLVSFSAHAEKVSLKSLTDQFNAVVFIHEHGKQGAEPKPLIKWVKPIIFSPSGTLTKKQFQQFTALMTRIQKLTKLDMRMAKKGDKVNFVIHFVPKDKLAKQMPKGVNCYGKIGANKEYEITRGRAYIPSDRPDKTDHCLVEETVQLFGLTNDSKLVKNSMFYEQSKRTSMSITDQILLKTLYDDRLKTGMSQEEAQPVLREILKEFIDKVRKKQKAK